MTLQASDPDTGDGGQLVYSLAAESPYFDVEPSSGLVTVKSVEALAGQLVKVEVRATDPGGLQATTTVEVSVVHGGESCEKNRRASEIKIGRFKK